MYGRRLPYLIAWPLLLGMIVPVYPLSRSGTDGIACFPVTTAPSAFVDNITVILLCMCFAIVM